MKKTKFFSFLKGKLPKGCRQCVKGEKTVLFITGICPRKCFYCPISDQKKNKDVIYFNERPSRDFKDLITEIKLCDSKGVGITGGDPLVKLERTCKYIKELKKTFGKKFHIHLYTPPILVNKNSLEKLYKAGLDEIRFHPEITNNKLWKRIELAKEYDWKIGVEIPAIPNKEKETKKLIKFLENKIDFLNINELEVSDTNANKLIENNYTTKDRISYGVKGSEQLAKKLLKFSKIKNIHYCTCTLKDRVQLANRLKRRAKNASKPFDYVDNEGMLIKGVIYGKNLSKTKNYLIKNFDIPKELIEIDNKRLLTTVEVVDKLKDELKQLKLKPAIVKEYPTFDKMIVEMEFL